MDLNPTVHGSVLRHSLLKGISAQIVSAAVSSIQIFSNSKVLCVSVDILEKLPHPRCDYEQSARYSVYFVLQLNNHLIHVGPSALLFCFEVLQIQM